MGQRSRPHCSGSTLVALTVAGAAGTAIAMESEPIRHGRGDDHEDDRVLPSYSVMAAVAASASPRLRATRSREPPLGATRERAIAGTAWSGTLAPICWARRRRTMSHDLF